MEQASAPKEAIIIVGCHRSGTSMLARMMAALGWYMGSELLGEDPCNVNGLWENRKLVELNERILREAGSAWHDTGVFNLNSYSTALQGEWRSNVKTLLQTEFESREKVCIKDPRVCRFLPLYISAFKELGYDVKCLTMIRSPEAVAESLYKRDGLPRALGHQLWLSHNAESLKETLCLLQSNQLIINYDEFLNAQRSQIERLLAWIGDENAHITKLVGLINENLNHSPAERLNAAFGNDTRALYDVLTGKHDHKKLQVFVNRLMVQLPKKKWMGKETVRVSFLPYEADSLLYSDNSADLYIQDGPEDKDNLFDEALLKKDVGFFYNICWRQMQDSLVRGAAFLNEQNALLIVDNKAEIDETYSSNEGHIALIMKGLKVQAVFVPNGRIREIDLWSIIGKNNALDVLLSEQLIQINN